MIIETIVTTVDGSGTLNCAPMGVEWDLPVIVLKPFLETATYRNLMTTRAGVIHLTDDVRLFARAAISNPGVETEAPVVVDGAVLADCCSWREVRVRSIDSTPPRSRIETEVVHHGFRREFVGFNRAAHAVLEATIYATRLHLLEPAFVADEMKRLQVVVDKTAGPREAEAMSQIHKYVESARSVSRSDV